MIDSARRHFQTPRLTITGGIGRQLNSLDLRKVPRRYLQEKAVCAPKLQETRSPMRFLQQVGEDVLKFSPERDLTADVVRIPIIHSALKVRLRVISLKIELAIQHSPAQAALRTAD